MTLFNPPYLALLSGGISTFLLCIAIVVTKRWHGKHTLDSDEGIQKFHTEPTPRIGGFAVLIGLLASTPLLPSNVYALLVPILLAALPAFIFGITEDLTKRVSPMQRLLATMLSGLFACWLTGISLTRVDVIGFDLLLAIPAISVIFTAFAVAGIANAINIIDGFNGLAAGTTIICASTIGIIAFSVGDPVLAKLCIVIVAVLAGFLAVNFPYGKIFLGDGGAYLIGFLLAWIAILLPMRNPSISAWASLLICSYPIIEALFSMLRRRARALETTQPDRLHLHSLVKARFVKKNQILRKTSPVLRNSAVAPLMWCLSLLPSLIAIPYAQNTKIIVLGLLLSTLVYFCLYARLTNFKWVLPINLFIRERPVVNNSLNSTAKAEPHGKNT